jgi:hypothetical protein
MGELSVEVDSCNQEESCPLSPLTTHYVRHAQVEGGQTSEIPST